jgi:hypothetical protein
VQKRRLEVLARRTLLTARLCLIAYLFITARQSRSSAPALHCPPRSPARTGCGYRYYLQQKGPATPDRLPPPPPPHHHHPGVMH